MTKKLMVLLSASLVAGAVLTAPALAGGGPHCDSAIEDVRSTTVTLTRNCFTPTIARIEAGDEVTFVNEDPVPHTVTGALFAFGGMDELDKGDRVTYRFEDEGIFPYTCVIHPGMVGAIVVGDGKGTGAGTVSDVSFYGTNDAMAEKAASEKDFRPSSTSASEGSGVPLWAIALAALGAVGALGFASSRLRRRVSTGVAMTTKP